MSFFVPFSARAALMEAPSPPFITRFRATKHEHDYCVCAVLRTRVRAAPPARLIPGAQSAICPVAVREVVAQGKL